MAYSNNYRSSKSHSNYKSSKKTSKKTSYTELERTAYNLGLIKRGLANKDSRVYESYLNGINMRSKKSRKPLI